MANWLTEVEPTPSGTGGKGHTILSKIVVAGGATRQRMSRMLGVDAIGAPYEVIAAAWMDHSLEVAIEGHEELVWVICIEKRRADSMGLARTQHLCIFTRGEQMPAALSETVSRAARIHFATWTIDRLADLVADDPEMGKAGQKMPPQTTMKDRPQALLDTWGAADTYADFWAHGEVSRGQLDSVDPSKVFHFVQHCESECLYLTPHSIGTIANLVNYPWSERIRELGRPPYQMQYGDMQDREYMADGMSTTDLTEDDVIRGNPKKLNDMLREALNKPHAQDKILFVANTCTPIVVGDDTQGQVENLAEETGRDILYLTVNPRSMNNVLKPLFAERRIQGERAIPVEARDPRAINLVGFCGGQRARDEVEGCLRDNGVTVNTRLFPEMTIDGIIGLAKAGASVYAPNSLYQHFYDQLLDRTTIPHMMPAAPYGFAATRKWVAAIVDRLGLMTDGFDEWWERYSAPHLEEYDALRARVRENEWRIGFVIRDSEAYYMTRPAATWGVPLISLMEEMGFGVDVLIKCSTKKTTRKTARAVYDMFGTPKRHKIVAFDSIEMMREKLAACPADAFLSYHFLDWRLTEAGKNFFSMQHFEMGVPGAVRTLERIAGVCETPFYRKYNKYLKRNREGLRRPWSSSATTKPTAPKTEAAKPGAAAARPAVMSNNTVQRRLEKQQKRTEPEPKAPEPKAPEPEPMAPEAKTPEPEPMAPEAKTAEPEPQRRAERAVSASTTGNEAADAQRRRAEERRARKNKKSRLKVRKPGDTVRAKKDPDRFTRGDSGPEAAE